jgi:hypothetical protein
MAFDALAEEYRLGLELAEFGALVDVDNQSRRVALPETRRVSDELRLGCST